MDLLATSDRHGKCFTTLEPAELRQDETADVRLRASEFDRVLVLKHRAAITPGRADERLDPVLGDGRQVATARTHKQSDRAPHLHRTVYCTFVTTEKASNSCSPELMVYPFLRNRMA